MNRFLAQCRALIGPAHVLTSEIDHYVADWRGRTKGVADAVLRPANTEEVAALVRLCAAHQVAVVPQGGNTGLVLGGAALSTPSNFAGVIILSLTRMNQIEAIDATNNSMVVQAGAILQTVQEAARGAQRLFPLSLAAQGTCTIGGNLATNAGGVHVVRYGTMRQLCLGLEVVTAQGEIINGLLAVHKNNSGYDWRDLLIGSEGTLGLITRAVLKLFPLPRAHATAWVFCESLPQVIALLTQAQNKLGNFLSAFEVMIMPCVALVREHFPEAGVGLTAPHAFALLLELEHNDDAPYLQQSLLDFLAQQTEAGLVADALIAQSEAQRKAYWQVRELLPAAEARAAKAVKHDIALPISALASFVARAEATLAQTHPGCTPFYFGHCGDGNLHYNVFLSAAHGADFAAAEQSINQVVYDLVTELGGSFSAEHGVGRLRVDTLTRYRAPAEIALMRTLKTALDPQGILNPGAVLAAQ